MFRPRDLGVLDSVTFCSTPGYGTRPSPLFLISEFISTTLQINSSRIKTWKLSSSTEQGECSTCRLGATGNPKMPNVGEKDIGVVPGRGGNKLIFLTSGFSADLMTEKCHLPRQQVSRKSIVILPYHPSLHLDTLPPTHTPEATGEE